MKKIVLIGVCVLMISTLCGCGGEKSEEVSVQEGAEMAVSEEMTDQQRIEQEIRSREERYTTAKIESVTVNENAGTEEAGDYIVLVNMALNPMSEKTGNDIMTMFSDDIAANLHEKGYSSVAEVAVFWKDEHNGRDAKFSYEHADEGFAKQK